MTAKGAMAAAAADPAPNRKTMSSAITQWLGTTSQIWFGLYASLAAFTTYFCMYAFRKPFTAGSFEGLQAGGVNFKILLIIAQALGYMISKFVGIKVISELSSERRGWAIIGLIAFAEFSLLLFAVIPYPYNFICLFLNGLPLGMIWGLVFSFLEGRAITEALAAGLSASFVVSSGFVKTVAREMTIHYQVTEFWAPFYTGLLFFPLLILAVWALEKIPLPLESDKALRTERTALTGADRLFLIRKYLFGFFLFIVLYTALTIFRDFRDNFAVELWNSLGYKDAPSILTFSEIPIAVIVLIVAASTIFFKNNLKAFWINHLIILSGGVLVGLSTLLFSRHLISPVLWMIGIGLGTYLGYIVFQCNLYERFIAAFKEKANVGFLTYMSDAFGYSGSVALLIYKNFGAAKITWIDFFMNFSYILSALIMVSVGCMYIYFQQKRKTHLV